MENVWLISALWIGLALFAAFLSVRLAVSVALTEIVVGAIASNLIHLQITDWVNWLAGGGAILLTFLAGVLCALSRHPVLRTVVYAWPWDQAQIAGIALSTTSVAVVYAVMVETGLNKTQIGWIWMWNSK